MFLVFLFLSIIGIFFCLLAFKIRDSSGSGELVREAHSESTTGLELHSGGFLILRKFSNFFFLINPLYHVTTLDRNVPTSRR